MALSVHTNYASLVTQNQLGKTNSMLSTAMQRLGTGLRINSASDDAAGLQIATRLQTQSNGQKIGMRNAQDAISMMQTAEGALSEMTSIGQRMKDIATQAANGTNGKAEYTALNDEYKELAAELTNIAQNTQYGEGKKLLATEVSVADATTNRSLHYTVEAAQSTLDAAIGSTVTGTTAAGATVTAATDTTKITAAVVGTFDTAASQITAVDSAKTDLKTAEDAAAGKIGVASSAGAFGAEITFQIGSSANENMKLDTSGKLGNLAAAQAGLGKVTDQASAKTAMASADRLLDAIGSLRGQFGASINRLDHTINNLGNMNQNIELSKGRIMDADFAAESANMTKQQLLMQSGMSVLGKSNQIGGMVMGLLR
ncbi:flagellin N-terminal helical domain-containing protein [Moritella yayanosii]|uniref:Flagellin n=1 Tax=Moritella yayanosii TaxID=69539 RepID=A0A330LPL3_9GAMM|nr:flagellin [Moritella yayanosii]SQD78643.1 Lateral flagellin [Moritella yayanosii]